MHWLKLQLKGELSKINANSTNKTKCHLIIYSVYFNVVVKTKDLESGKPFKSLEELTCLACSWLEFEQVLCRWHSFMGISEKYTPHFIASFVDQIEMTNL